MKILIVDDSAMILVLLENALSLEDHEVEKARDAEEAIDMVTTFKFDIGIFDVNMPGKSGLELIPIIKSMENGKDMKIVILTTESSEEMKTKAKLAGAKAWLVKPFQNDQLIELVNLLAK